MNANSKDLTEKDNLKILFDQMTEVDVILRCHSNQMKTALASLANFSNDDVRINEEICGELYSTRTGVAYAA